MKRFFESFTLLQLILLGFLAVILPLAAALFIAVIQSEELAASSREALVSVQTSTDISRQLSGRIRDLERSARQYMALNDMEILALYREHRREVLELLAVLRNVSGSADISRTIEVVTAAEQGLFTRIDGFRASSVATPGAAPPMPRAAAGQDTQEIGNAPQALSGVPGAAADTETSVAESELEAAFKRLRDSSSELLALYSQRGRELANQLPRQASSQRTFLVMLAAMVIPLSLLLAGIFLVLASRPLRQLNTSIRTLGRGALQAPIEIRGARDLVDLGHRLDWLRTRLIALEEQKMLFLRDVSHELKTPLTNIREASGLLLDGPEKLGDSETATVTRILHENGLRLQSLIEELLRFGAADGDQGDGGHKPLALHELVMDIVGRQSIAARARGLHLVTDLAPITVVGNARQLEIIVDNLLSNAIKFTPDGGRIDVRLHQQGKEAHLDVIDEGPGVAAEHRDAIFEWFFRGNTDSHAVVDGSGMGLAIASEYARQHMGALQLMPASAGAHFRLSLSLLENP